MKTDIGQVPGARRTVAGKTHHSRSGIALIITLIMLSVTLVMAVAFLALSRRERASVTTTTDSANARLAADAALAHAEAQAVAGALSGDTNFYGTVIANPFKFGLLVSTNYIDPFGFQTAPLSTYTNTANVNYTYAPGAGGGPVTGTDFLQMLANLYYLPRPPVFIPQNGSNDFRYYLDLNRNGRYDTNGLVTNVDNNLNGFGTASIEVGDPEWIGVLDHPDQPYGPNNKFISRYAFVAVPIGNALDLNSIHNQSLIPADGYPEAPMNFADDGYYRNQGVGSWELNLAAFLTDLNTNQWDVPSAGVYQYRQALPGGTFPNAGGAFADAFSLLSYRYEGNYTNLESASYLFNPNSPYYPNYFINGNVDGYSDFGLQTNFDTNYNYSPYVQNTTQPWAGSDNPQHFYYEPSELFGFLGTFPGRMIGAGTTNSTYDRYTFYRMLSQLGTDSTPESGKMNLNYDNVDYTNYSANSTNFIPWTPIAFFTNAANRMLQMYTATWATNYTTNLFGAVIPGVATNYMPVLYTNFVGTYNMTNNFWITGNILNSIPVLVSNQFCYTPAVNRVLQLAANLYEATSTNYYPSVYRPLFTVTNQNNYINVYITGYTNVVPVLNDPANGTDDPQLAPPIDIASLVQAFLQGGNGSPQSYVNVATNIYGIPWIIGARKGFPNFNESVVESIVGMTRRLQFTRNINNPTAGTPITGTNQMYMFSLNTSGGLDFWNSYSNNLLDNMVVDYRIDSLMYITNSEAVGTEGVVPSVPSSPVGFFASNSVPLAGWAGSGSAWPGGQPNVNSFYVPLNFAALTSLSNSVYRTRNAGETSGTLPPGFPAPYLIPTNYFNTLGMSVIFETNVQDGTQLLVPEWGLLTTNQLQVYVLDKDANGYDHVVDYVHLEQANSQNLNNEIFVDDTNGLGNAQSPQGIWNTNTDTKYNTPWGIYNQIRISEGTESVPGEDGTWQGDPEATTYSSAIGGQMADFQAFFYPWGFNSTVTYNGVTYYGSNYEASVQAPYSPTRYAVGYTFLEPNDPLVHYLASDMTPSFPDNLQTEYNNFITNVPPPTQQPFTLGKLDYNFQPWGGNPYNNKNSGLSGSIDPLAYSLEERDPGAYGSDDWDFPTNKLPNIGWIGRVHRGTPWQTVYMKPTDILKQAYKLGSGPAQTAGTGVWAQWTGDREITYNQNFDAQNSAPIWDQMLFDLFTTGISDNATRGQLSVNTAADQYDPNVNPAAGLAGWSAVLSGVAIPPTPGTTNTYSIISPAGTNGIYSALGEVVTNINATRNAFVNLDGVAGTFEHKGNIFSAPLLSVQSPFLDLAQSNSLNDEMYEWVPQQVMGLLRGQSAPRYVVYSYGQTLKPAPNGIYTGSTPLADGESVFGMVTNYQVTAESATRAVIRIDGLTDANGNALPPGQQHPRAVIESFSVLPPD